jgi:hypothetical protein
MPATLLLFEMKEDFHLTRGQRQIGGHEMVYSSWITEANSENIKNLALHSVKDQASMTSVPSVVLMHQSPTPHEIPAYSNPWIAAVASACSASAQCSILPAP